MVELRDELLTVAEAAALVRVTPHTIYRWIALGKLPAVRYSPRVLRVRLADLEQHREAKAWSAPAVRETGVTYEVGRSAREPDLEVEREEVRQLMENYRKLSRRRRRPGEPPKGSPEAILRHVGVISEEEGEELRRIIMEDRERSLHDPVFSFDEPA